MIDCDTVTVTVTGRETSERLSMRGTLAYKRVN
jgi:hypothetical protein